MLWVLAAVGCFVVVHTVVNLAYRKPAPAHEPAAEARERQRLFVKADLKGWTRFAARLASAGESDLGTNLADARATIARRPAPENLAAALPFDLVGIFTTDPRLHEAPRTIHAADALAVDDTFRVGFRFEPTAKPAAFGEPLAFAKDQHLYLFLQDESRPAFEQPPTTFAPEIQLALPPDVLAPGAWKASLYTADAVFEWEFEVTGGGLNP